MEALMLTSKDQYNNSNQVYRNTTTPHCFSFVASILDSGLVEAETENKCINRF